MATERPSQPRPEAPPGVRDDLEGLRQIVEGTAGEVGEAFFPALVRNLAAVLGTGYAFVAEFAGEGRARTLAYWKPGGLAENVEWDLAGTPCEEVVRGRLCHHASGVSGEFPGDRPLVEMGIESYLGVPLVAPGAGHLGHLCVFDTRPMPSEPRKLAIFRIFAARAAAELSRLRLERALAQSEERLRDLFEEAPIAYVHEDLDSKFIRANRTALRTLGIRPDEVEGMVGRSLVPDTPEAQRRLQEAFAAVERGMDANGVVLELRRKDDGRPLWIQWWSRPEPGGKTTRTMFIDITEKVLLEQEQARLEAQNVYLREEIQSVHNFEEIVGRSPALQRVLEEVGRVAPTDASVLITGETGTGKELVARAIHSNSQRRTKPLIKVSCAALSTNLVESELFGHEKGAFSGAIARRVGRFELAHGGTIFLDEVGDIPMEMQVKLLRVLQEREFERVGSNVPLKADVRVIAATNRDLHAAMREGRFREDLYYRLAVFPIELPPLRERTGDIPLLVQFFLEKFAMRIGKQIDGVSRETLARLQAYPWSGNVRELENVIERAVILCRGGQLEVSPGLLPVAPAGAAGRPQEPLRGLEDLDREHILATLRATAWRIEGAAGAAARLGINPSTLRSKIKKLGIVRSREGAR